MASTPTLPEQPSTSPQAGPAALILVGNPNVGKSVLFGHLTGRYVTVSNYPGTTVTLTRGKGRVDGASVEVLDTPGVNSLLPMSEDEAVTLDILLRHPGAGVILVADAKNLRRGLMLAAQLAELGIAFVLDLNMTDEAEDLGVQVDREALEQALQVPVVRTVAVTRKGFDALERAVGARKVAHIAPAYPRIIEDAVDGITARLPETHLARRGVALTVLSGDPAIVDWLREQMPRADLEAILAIRDKLDATPGVSPASRIEQARQRAVADLVRSTETRAPRRPGSLADRVGSLAMHPVWGIPVLLVILWGMYQLVGVFGAGTLVDLLETQVFQNQISPLAIRSADALLHFPHEHVIEEGVRLPEYTLGAGELTTAQSVAQLIHDGLVGPYGQITMALSYALALILPIVATFFLCFGILEDSGYLPRLAVMVNGLFRRLGLNGKAVLPMVLGLGCDTMATLTARILETKKERILVTLLLALAVPCSAQLGVILGMIRSLSFGATLVWAGTVTATLVIVGWIAARVVPGESADFILELPPIRRPQFRNLIVKTLARIEWYLREAVPLFLLGTLVLFVLDRLNLMVAIERLAAPVVQGVLGLPAAASEAFLIGFLRRDYGAAGLYDLAREGALDPVQLVVSMVTITLFVPCIANFFIMIKERGMRTALAIVAVIVPMAFLVGGGLNFTLRALGVTF